MFKFENKTILILSPEKWGDMHISKHNYAIELSKNNRVFFFNPPVRQIGLTTTISIHNDYNNLHIVNYKLFSPYVLKFHLRLIFNYLFNLKIKSILRKIKTKPDVIWSFDLGLFPDLNLFNARYKIFHPVDVFNIKDKYLPIKSADLIISVADKILENIPVNKTKIIINHGLSGTYLEKAKLLSKKKITIQKKNKINVGYIGNLLNSTLDSKIFNEIIKQNPDIEFHLWGSYSSETANLGGELNEMNKCFIDFIQKANNVILYGNTNPKKIIEDIDKIDVFILIYKYPNGDTDRINAHKILECLSTGKVVVCTQISYYKNFTDLIPMTFEKNEDFPALFQKVITNLEYYNSPELQKKRIEYALDNTYEKQIERIEKIISDNLEKNINSIS